jgi:hypothetical protein
MVGNVVPNEDKDIRSQVERALRRQKLDVIAGARPTADDIEVTGKGVKMKATDPKGKVHELEAEALFVAIGRQGNIEDIGLEELGIKTERDIIPVDEMMRTNVEGVYAIGDVNGQQMLAHSMPVAPPPRTMTLFGRSSRTTAWSLLKTFLPSNSIPLIGRGREPVLMMILLPLSENFSPPYFGVTSIVVGSSILPRPMNTGILCFLSKRYISPRYWLSTTDSDRLRA